MPALRLTPLSGRMVLAVAGRLSAIETRSKKENHVPLGETAGREKVGATGAQDANSDGLSTPILLLAKMMLSMLLLSLNIVLDRLL